MEDNVKLQNEVQWLEKDRTNLLAWMMASEDRLAVIGEMVCVDGVAPDMTGKGFAQKRQSFLESIGLN